MVMITIDDLDTTAGLLMFQEACRDADACQPALDHIAASITTGLTLRECMDQAPTEKERRDWAMWCRLTIASHMTEDVRLTFSEIAIVDSPRLAAQICIDRFDCGKDEAIVLLSKWHSAMNDVADAIFPQIEIEIQRGPDGGH